MSTDFFRRYLDLLNEAETRVKLVANQPVIPGQPLSSVQMAIVDIARSMGNQMGPEVDRAYDLARQAGVKPGPGPGGRADSTNKQSDEAPSNTRSGQPPADFTPTHFHKNNLGFKIPLMQTPDGNFWWETTATSDDGGAVQRGSARKSIQPWTGDTENRSSGLSGKSSVDGIFKDGKAIEFPEGMTWKEYAASAEKSPQAALPAAKSKQIEPELLAPLEPTDLGTFSNDQALVNLAASGSAASVAAGSLPAGTQFAYVPGDGTSKDISGKKDSSGLPSAAEIGAGAAASKKIGKETVITDSLHCAQCGTPKSIHAPLKHEFVPGDDVRPGSVGGSRSSSNTSTKSSSDTLAADQARIDKIPAWDRAKNAPVGVKPTPSPRPKPPKPLKEDINRLPVVDQMRSWRQLMEAPADAQQAAQRAGLGRPGSIGVGNKPDVRSLNDKARDVGRQRFDATSSIDHTPIGSTQLPSSAGSTSSTTSTAAQPRSRDFTSIDRRGPRPPPPPPELPGFAQSRIQGRPTGTAASAETMAARGIPGMDVPAPAAPPAAPAGWKSLVKNSLRRIAAPASALYSVYEGWNQINALPKDKMSRAQYAAEVTKIVTKLVEENGIVLVSTWLGGIAGGAITGGAGAIPGMVAGAAAGMAAEYYFGDNISEVVNGVVDSLYGTGNAPVPAPQENKLTPKQIADYKAYVENTEKWVAERTTWSPADQAANPWTKEDQAELDQYKAELKAAGVTVAPAPKEGSPKEGSPKEGSPKEGDTGTVPGNPPKKVIFKNGKWVPQ